MIQGIYTWLANGLALLIEWVWSVLDSGTTPRVTQDWFRNELSARVGLIGLAVTVAMMLASAMQAALAGRPEQIGDAVKEGVRAIVASALTVDGAGRADRGDRRGRRRRCGRSAGPTSSRCSRGWSWWRRRPGRSASTFVGPLCLLFGFIGLIGLVVALMMRSALIYVAAALAPIVWSANVLPLFRGSARKLVHLTRGAGRVEAGDRRHARGGGEADRQPGRRPRLGAVINDGAAAVGTLMSGFVCFLIAAVTPFVLYKLMPTVEGAMVGAGVAGGWGRRRPPPPTPR